MRNVIDEGMGRLHTSTTDLKRTRGKALAGPWIANALSEKVFPIFTRKTALRSAPAVDCACFGSTFLDAPTRRKEGAQKKREKDYRWPAGPRNFLQKYSKSQLA